MAELEALLVVEEGERSGLLRAGSRTPGSGAVVDSLEGEGLGGVVAAGGLGDGFGEPGVIEGDLLRRSLRVDEHVLCPALDAVRVPEVIGVGDPVRGARHVDHQVVGLGLQVVGALVVGRVPCAKAAGAAEASSRMSGKRRIVRVVNGSSSWTGRGAVPRQMAPEVRDTKKYT